MEFMLRAHARGFPVGKPFGAEHYDVMVDSSGRIWRVQVRCTNSRHYRGFTVRSFWKRGPKEYFAYTPAEIDFLAVYILTHEIWYIIPVRALKGRVGFDVYPFGTRGAAEFEKYKEAWDLLKKNLQPHSRALSS